MNSFNLIRHATLPAGNPTARPQGISRGLRDALRRESRAWPADQLKCGACRNLPLSACLSASHWFGLVSAALYLVGRFSGETTGRRASLENSASRTRRRQTSIAPRNCRRNFSTAALGTGIQWPPLRCELWAEFRNPAWVLRHAEQTAFHPTFQCAAEESRER